MCTTERCFVTSVFSLLLYGTVSVFVCPSRHASCFGISLHDLCRRLLARSTFVYNIVYFENGYHESSSRGAP